MVMEKDSELWRLNLYGQDYFDQYIAYLKSKFSVLKTSNRKLPKVGDSIHICSVRGIYKIHMIIGHELIITCNKWQEEHARGERPYALQRIHRSDFKCLQGLPFTRKQTCGQ
jgi:hypothetical protein